MSSSSSGPGPGAEAPRVLVGFADALAAVECVWSLRDAGYQVMAFTRPGRMPAAERVRGVRVHEVPAPETDAEACRKAVAALARDTGAAAVLPLDDHAVALCDGLFVDEADGGPVLVGPSGDAAAFTLDKREQLAAAARAGFVVPPSVLADSSAPGWEEALGDGMAASRVAVPTGVDGEAVALGAGPWMVKPALAVVERAGRLERPTGRLAATPEQAREVAAGIGGPVIVQPVVSGVGEGIFGLVTADGEVVGWSGHRRVRMMNPRGSGSSACRSWPVPPGLREAAERFLAEVGWRGLFMIELLRGADGRPYFMELNGRPWGSMALARRRGLDYPAWAVRERLQPGHRPDVPADPPELVARHLGRELVHLAAVLRGANGADADVWPRRWPTIRAVLALRRGECWYNWRPGEPGVLLRDTWSTLANQLGRRS